MREIKFRGKRVDNGEWVYGTYIKSFRSSDESRKHWILYGAGHNGGALMLYDRYQVDEKTVGQFTGLKDKNGKEIYEGDILSDGDCSTRVYWNQGEAQFSNGVTSWRELLQYIEIIGNVHEAVK